MILRFPYYLPKCIVICKQGGIHAVIRFYRFDSYHVIIVIELQFQHKPLSLFRIQTNQVPAVQQVAHEDVPRQLRRADKGGKTNAPAAVF